MKLTTEQKKFCDTIYDDTNVELAYILENEGLEDIDSLYEYVEDNCLTDDEIIYYGNALEYLGENDPSFSESVALASDMGYELAEINSELLASLLVSKNNRDSFENYRDEIKEMFF